VPASIGTQNIVYDLPATKRFAELLRPLTLFGKGHIASLMYDFAHSQYLMAYGREHHACEVLERLCREFPDPSIKKILGEAHWKAMYGGILFSLGVVYPYRFGNRALEVARQMEELGVRVWAMAAEEVRMLHHAQRGELEAVQRCRERVELYAVQGSTTWQADIFWPILLMDSEVRAGDAIAVRTVREQVSRRARDFPSLQLYADVAHANYLALRGEHGGALAAYERILSDLGSLDADESWQPLRACIARAMSLNMLGEHARAKQAASEVLERAGTSEAEHLVGHYLEARRQIALAEAGLGNHTSAAQLLDGLLDQHGDEDQPLLIGLLHKARAEVALLCADGTAFEQHFDAMASLFRATKHPALIAQTARLGKRGIAAGVRIGELYGPSDPQSLRVSSGARRALSDLLLARDRCDHALKLMIQECHARAGFLYLLRDGAIELAAASHYNPPPTHVEEQVRGEIERARQELADEGETAAIDAAAVHPERSVFMEARSSEPAHRVLVLYGSGADDVLVGAIALEPDPHRSFQVDFELLEPIAAALSGGASEPLSRG